MSGGLIAAIRRANAPRPPEDSIAARVSVFAAVFTGAVALASVQAISGPTATLVLVALPFAYWVSWKRRRKDNWHIKIGLSIGAIFALMRFLGQIGGIATLDEIRFPLADLFLWVQVLHSFDVPARKDLHFSLGSSLTLMAVAGSISQSLSYLPFLIVYFACAVAALSLGHRSEIGEGTDGWMKTPTAPGATARTTGRVSRTTDILRAAGVTALAAVVLFLVVPQPTGVRTFALPFSLGNGAGLGAFGSDIANPGGGAGGGIGRSRLGAYFGVDNEMDLRVRGQLSDELVMRVRASGPAMWKGVVFEKYDGDTWKVPEAEPLSLGGDSPHLYPLQFRSLGPRSHVSQTFYIEVEQPSVLFAAGQPDQVWFSGSLSIDEIGSLRTAATLTPGTVYSVVSSRGAAGPKELRAAEGEIPESITRFLQLPESLPRRVEELARRITRGATNAYDKVKMIEEYLADNFEYNIASPVPPPGDDAVDHFLFETDVGFCEQFASATTVMLRSLGIPARVAAGYTPGERSAFTGYYEVKASDAHSWIEVYFPELGWYEFDPTFAIPPSEVSVADMIPLARAFRFLAEKVGALLPEGMGAMAKNALTGALVLAIVGGAWVAWRKLRPAPRIPGPAPPPPVLGGRVTRAFGQLERVLAMAGAGRAPPETAAELMARAADLSEPATQHALHAFERERYGAAPPPEREADAAVAELHRLAGLHLEPR
ncbi:MAG TPA: transglutaminaseTgpA domain-containing protein [Actinomycetota bacterium]|nr:transglutaminaseTgpA domain-containing protein [Actinomycetota bacterium]